MAAMKFSAVRKPNERWLMDLILLFMPSTAPLERRIWVQGRIPSKWERSIFANFLNGSSLERTAEFIHLRRCCSARQGCLYSVIQTLAANGSDQPLHKWILPGRSRCRNYGFCAHALDRCANFSPENRISIADQIARRFLPGKSFSKLLHGPLLRRVFRYVPVQYASPIVRQHEENEEHAKGGRRYREEVHRSHLRHVIREERSPRFARVVCAFAADTYRQSMAPLRFPT